MNLIKRFFIFAALITLSISTFAQANLDKLMRSRNEYYFSIEASDKADIHAINNIVSIDKIIGNKIVCYANNAQYDKLLAAGYTPTLLTPPSMLEEAKMWNGGDRATYDWSSYPTYSAYEQMMNDYGNYDNCTIMTLGTLNSGRKIMVARINNGEPEGKPRFLYTSTIHGDETTGWILMLRLIDYLLTSNDSRVANIVNNLDIFICPNTNPDGTFHGGNNTVNGATRYNANGIDLNRHFPDPVDGPHPDGESTYQNECTWMMNLAQQYLFTMGGNYHGGAEVVNYPWDNSYTRHVDDAWWQLVSRKYANTCHSISANYMTDENNGITNGADWYMIGGGRQDYMNYYAECREATIECSTTKCPSANQLPTFWDYNKDAMLAYLEQALYGIHGTVTDYATNQPLQGVKVKVLNHDEDYANVSSHEAGDYHRVIKAGTYSLLFSKEGYCPVKKTVTVTDGETTNLDVELVPGDCILADFTADKTIIATGQAIRFTDLSLGNNINSWNWQFEGGTPSTSTQQNPTVTYNTPGLYSVTLTVSSPDDSDTDTRTEYITVVDKTINMGNGTTTTCNALFYDDGGPNSSYGNNKDYTLTIYPNNNESTLQVIFGEFNTENNYDFLSIYDGASTNSTLIGKYSGSSSPGIVESGTPGGALTFNFSSDSYKTESGWVALINCIEPLEPLEVQATATPESIIEGQSTQLTATVQGGTGQYTYSWEPANTLDDAETVSPVATPTETTIYTVTVSDGNSSESASVTVIVTPDGIIETTDAFKIYPNPAKDEVNIELSDKNARSTYRLFNVTGQELGKGTISGATSISTANLDRGVYFIEISNEGLTTTSKIIVR